MTKLKKINRTYIIVLLLITLSIICFSTSYAFFTGIKEEHGKLNIVVGDLTYKLESNDLINHQITVNAGETKEIIIALSSLNSIDSKYELYYTLEQENDNVKVGYSNDTKDAVLGKISANGSKVITVGVNNGSDKSITITFSVIGGLVNNELVLTEGYSLNQVIETKVGVPIIAGGSNSWVSIAPTISVLQAGDALSGVKHYEYYKSTTNTAPENSTPATGTTEGDLIISDLGTTYIWYRTVSNNGNKSVWTGPQVVNLDTTTPVISVNSNLPESITIGDSYLILGNYTNNNPSGSSASCKSNHDGNITNTSQLTTFGQHTITCTVTLGTNKSASITKEVYVYLIYEDFNDTKLAGNMTVEFYPNGYGDFWAIENGRLVGSYYDVGDNEVYFLLNISPTILNSSKATKVKISFDIDGNQLSVSSTKDVIWLSGINGGIDEYIKEGISYYEVTYNFIDYGEQLKDFKGIYFQSAGYGVVYIDNLKIELID